MRRLLIAIVAAVSSIGLTQVGSAAELPTKAPLAPALVPYSWTGFYVGANGGGSWGHSDTDVTLVQRTTEVAIGSTSPGINGLLGGFQAGYRWQTNSVILGAETDIQITGQQGTSHFSSTLLLDQACLAPCTPPPPVPVTGAFDATQKLPWFGTLRGVLGVSPWDRALVYVTGGFAYGRIQTDAMFSVAGGACLAPCTPPPTVAAGSFAHNKGGWVAGVGIETALVGNWSGKLEYLHIDLGDISDAFSSALAAPFSGTFAVNSHITDDIVRVGVNYRLSP